MEDTHILVVEDDPDINNLLAKIVTNAGYDCRQAFSGSEAAMLCDQYRYDLILLDLMLPGLTGEELIARLRKGKTMPIIVLSAKAGLEDRINVLGLGADDFQQRGGAGPGGCPAPPLPEVLRPRRRGKAGAGGPGPGPGGGHRDGGGAERAPHRPGV